MNKVEEKKSAYKQSNWTDEEAFRDTLSTLDEKGNRKWVYAKSTSGIFTKYRSVVAVLLMAFLFAAPFITINGHPLLLFDVLNRKFIIMGQVFWPQDFHIFAVGAIASVLFIVLFTVAFGRIFCGWICPQTIFMEFFFRFIERKIEGDAQQQYALDKAPWTAGKIFKKTLKHAIFLIFAFVIGNVFLSYLIGFKGVWQLVEDGPMKHIGGFVAMLGFTGAFYLVFAFVREQVCTAACPYGRLQGVLLDPDSIVIAYDFVRGEPRDKYRKGEERTNKGDCINCLQCIQVCPTGIDIRNGTQYECINCTACIDACDNMMDRVGMERGLIRYATHNEIKEKKKFSFNLRLKAYTAVLSLIVVLLVTLLVTRTDFEAVILRLPGTSFQKNAKGEITNVYQYQIVNKTMGELQVRFELKSPDGSLTLTSQTQSVRLSAEKSLKGMLIVGIDPKAITKRKNQIEIDVYNGKKHIETIKTNFLGPS